MEEESYNRSMPGGCLFAYGTLRSGECRHWLLEPGKVKSSILGSVRGTLFDLGDYPGMRLEAEASRKVQGEIFEFEDLERILALLDEEEGPDYRRELVSVQSADGQEIQAWAYVLISEPAGAPEITTGDWRRYAGGSK